MSRTETFGGELLNEIQVHVDNNYMGLGCGESLGFGEDDINWDLVKVDAHEHLDQFVGHEEVSRHLASFTN
jgi:hypothetical protein